MGKVDVKPTAESIRATARYLRDTAARIDHVADKMENTGDLSYAAEVMSEMTGIFLNGRLDLLITRPIRAYEYLIDKENL